MYADAVARIAESMFPIFFVSGTDEQAAIGVSGTGFFVDDTGLFVTVDHIMHCAPPGSTYVYYGKIPDEACETPVEIECVSRDAVRDLYLGRIRRDYLPPVELAGEVVRPGDSVCLSGYPMAVIGLNEHGAVLGSVRRYLQPTFVVDRTAAVIERRQYEGYIVQHPCYAGMSGAPVFDIQGRVRGMAVANLTRTIPELGGPATVVSNGIVADMATIRGFIGSR